VAAKQDALTDSSDLQLNSLNTQALSVISGGQAHDSILYLATPFDIQMPSRKCALIAEGGINHYSKSKFHLCLNNASDNSNTSVADSKLSVDKAGLVTIPGSLVVGTTNVMTAIADLQSSSGVDSSTALHVASLKATGAISVSGGQEQVEIGRSGHSAIVRISSTYAALRLEGVAQSGSWTGFTLTRNNITQSTSANLGTTVYQSWAPGMNVFHQQVVMHGPLTFASGPKLQRANDDSLEFYAGSGQQFHALTMQGSDGHVVAHIGLYNNSDESLKEDVAKVDSERALEVLKAVEPMTYRRNDIADDSPRLGFIAQHVQAAIPPEWANLVGTTGGSPEYVDDDGNTVPAKASTVTLDYSRLCAVLWSANRSMLARLEALEARLQ